MRIEVYSSLDCPSGEPSLENVRAALAAEDMHADVSLTKIDDDRAISMGLSGSPSVIIDSVELQPAASSGFS